MKKIQKILLAVGLYLLDMTLATLLVYLLYYAFGINYNEFNITLKILFNVLVSLLLMLIFYFIYRKCLKKDIKDYIKNFKEYFAIGTKAWTVGVFGMAISNIIIFLILGNTSANEVAVQTDIQMYPLYMFFQAVIFAPLIEELIFRKSIRDIIDDDYAYIIISGLLFGLIHVIGALETGNLTEFLFVIPYGLVGASFAYTYVKTKNITVSISIHALHNAILLSFSLLRMYLG